MQIEVYPIICLVTIKINNKGLFHTFFLLLMFDSLKGTIFNNFLRKKKDISNLIFWA